MGAIEARVIAAVLTLGSCAALAQSPEDMRALVEKGQAESAYQLGRRAPQRLGDPAFDLAFGIAAIASGHAAEGVLALERFLLTEPGHEAARVELARGYFLLGDDVRAREEFELALSRRPPPGVARVIAEHLAALRERESRYRPTAMAFVELGGGYDSNPRAGVDNPLISLPVIGEVTVTQSGVRVSDRTVQYGAGFRVTAPAFAHVAAFAAGQVDVIRYPRQNDFDQALYAGSLGFLGQWRRHAWRAGGSIGYQTLNRQPYRRTHGFFTDWASPLGDRDAVSIGVQAGKLGYEGANSVRNSDFATLVAGWRHAFAIAWQPQADASVTVGRERNIYDDRQDLSRDLHGVRIGASLTPFPAWTLAAGAAWQRSRYHEPDLVLQTTRKDRYLAADLGLAWTATPAFTIRAELTDAKNASNLALYEYRRWTAILRGRYEFR
jgi:hypothetical protein